MNLSEFWQAYGNWITVAAIFIFMIGHHLLMGHGSHGQDDIEPDQRGHAHGTAEEDEKATGPRPPRQSGGCH